MIKKTYCKLGEDSVGLRQGGSEKEQWKKSRLTTVTLGGGGASTQLCPDVCVEGLKKDPF